MSRFLKNLLTVVGLLLVGCSTASPNPSVSLPLAGNQPTFLFFYTDN